ncbi:MAG: hypothetical protein VB960_10170 [Pseudohongiellaceae bacterium]
MSLIARHLEANGIPTLIIGSAIDVVEHCGVPRYLHSDFPLGNPCGKPYDKDMQRSIINQGVAMLHAVTKPNSSERTPYEWGENSWRDDYSKVDDSNREELSRRGENRRKRQLAEKAAGLTRSSMIADG